LGADCDILRTLVESFEGDAHRSPLKPKRPPPVRFCIDEQKSYQDILLRTNWPPVAVARRLKRKSTELVRCVEGMRRSRPERWLHVQRIENITTFRLCSVGRAGPGTGATMLLSWHPNGGWGKNVVRKATRMAERADFNPMSAEFYSNIVWTFPARTTDRPHWLGHVPFSLWLVEALRPRLLVELGSETGVSFSAMCQAIAYLGAPTRAVAIDTWTGDIHTGAYPERVYEDLSNYIQTNYARFATLLRSTFDDALLSFQDGSIDLLHIDGSHRYEDVKHDFESWLPKLSSRGVILFHDIEERNPPFGVWKFWREVCPRYPSFSFYHASGLGVLVVGAESEHLVFELTRLDQESAHKVQALYAALGERVVNYVLLKESEAAREVAETRASELSNETDELCRRLIDARQKLSDVGLGPAGNQAAESAALAKLQQTINEQALHIDSLTRRIETSVVVTEVSSERLGSESVHTIRELSSEIADLRQKLVEAVQTNFDDNARRTEKLMEAVQKVSVADALHTEEKIAGTSVRQPQNTALTRPPRSVWDMLLPWRLYSRLVRRQQEGHLAKLIRASLLFDDTWYLDQNQDVRSNGLDPLVHFVLWGAKEGRAPNALFDPAWYLTQNPDVRAAGTDPFTHFLKFGASEGRDPNPLFDGNWYLSQYPDVRAARINPLADYRRCIGTEPRQPHPFFNPNWYLAKYPDVRASGIDPLAHYLSVGAAEGRNPHPLFDTAWYLGRYPDVQAAGTNALAHFMKFGALEDRDPNPLFDADWYRAQHPELEASGVNPLLDYCRSAGTDGRQPHPLFDRAWYMAEYPDVPAAGVDPLVHYLEAGAAQGRNPHPLFDARWYLAQNPEVRAAGINPLVHYLESGAAQGRNPHPLFDDAWYLAKYADARAAGLNPLVHYLERGAAQDRNPHPLFDTAWYLARYPDVRAAGVDPLVHYLESGAAQGRHPNPLFDTAWYLTQYPDVRATGIGPLVHYLTIGAAQGRNPHPLFDSRWYLAQNPEVRAASLNPLVHYLESGAAQGLNPHPLFNAAWYLGWYPDVRAADINPLVHYLENGAVQGRNPSPLFDTTWYLTQYPDVRSAGIDPLTHYLSVGAGQGRNPHSLFDTRWYLTEYPDVHEAAINPLAHYLHAGGLEGRKPNPLFDGGWYLSKYPDVRAVGANPLVHYCYQGWTEGRDPSALFDTDWYLARYEDVRASNVNPLEHYLREGATGDRDPNPLFHSEFYVQQINLETPRAQELIEPSELAAPRKIQIGSSASTIFAYTSVTLNYIPKARALATTLKRHNPDIRFCLMLCEPVAAGVLDEMPEFDEIKTVDELDLPNLKSWIFSHSLVELCTAVKGFYLVELLKRSDCAAVFYFDPDIAVFDRIDPLLDGLKKSSIVLTPHLTEPEQTTDAILDNEICALQHGVFNLGFLGVKPTSEGLRFAEWWRDRLEQFCRADIPRGLFTDQRWVDLAPAFFSDIHIVRHPGCNVATWNLTHRRVEGSASAGYRVNGKELIFYHFSGFDSGAQEVMLNKYGSDMPAVHELRAWYIARTERPEDYEFFRRKSFYDHFDNGEPILREQRIRYRDALDLQQAFPDPFATSDVSRSYYHWYLANTGIRPALAKRESGEQYVASNGGQYLLTHFLTEGAAKGLRPSPYFDPAYYLQANPDVAKAGLNPLVHYLGSGAAEMRRPAREFDARFYVTQLASEEQQVCSNALAHYYEHGKARGLLINDLYDAKRNARVRGIMVRACARLPHTLLFVLHYGDGGADKHVRRLLELCRGKVSSLLIIPKDDGTVTISQPQMRASLRFDPLTQFDLLLAFLKDCGVGRVHVHHHYGNEHYLRRLIDVLDIFYDFTVHDYYTLSPHPHLIAPNGRFVGEDLYAAARQLLAGKYAKQHPASLAAWQAENRWLLLGASRVIVPTRDVDRRLRANIPSIQTIIAAHPAEERKWRPIKAPFERDARLRICVLGVVLLHKGVDILAACARLARANHDPIEFHVIGTTDRNRELLDLGVRITGPYSQEDLPHLLRGCSPHLLWYPAQCPETFSYTLSEGLHSGLPLVVPNLGAFPERVGARCWTWVREWNLEPEEWIDFFLSIRRENFAKSTPPEPVGVPWDITDEFYHEEYLDWACEDRTEADQTKLLRTAAE
jgi:glycosyltransferase involved in cell wall biosynthesis